GMHKTAKIPAVELIFTTLHSGGKFSDKAYTSSAGLHGVGASVTNALSEWLDVTVYRDGVVSHIKFSNGGHTIVPLEILGKTNKHGTTVRFKPDAKVFTTVDFKWDTIYNHLQESAFLMKKVRFILNDERSNLSQEFYYENGLTEYIGVLNQNKEPLSPIIDFDDTTSDIKIEIAFQYCSLDYNENILSYVNNVRTKDGGTHETGFRAAITRAVNDFANNNNLIKGKNNLEGSDIREGLTAILSLKIPESKLEFEGQTKGKLGTPEATTAVQNFFYQKLTYYLAENKDFALSLIKKCVDSQNARLAARKAKDDARTTNKAKSGRDRLHQAILPLRGKPLNTDSITIEQMLKNVEFATLVDTIGAGVGQNFDISESHYGKIIIMTDADTDGAHIQTLLLTFFYHFMRSLITHGCIYIAVPPLYRVMRENDHRKFFYAWDDKTLEDAKSKIGGSYIINRYKGLGEMSSEQLKETTMSPQSRTLIRVNIEDPLVVEQRITVLMGKDTTIRKKWVEENVDFNYVDTFIKEVK
ncbi:MAG: toprim domain-containing protein, partial [Firmicutes bacterium]|nr:toprim domain-containing protein [Bacillota bacterium]